MKQLLKAEFMRLRKTRSILITTIIFAVIQLFEMFIFYIIGKMNNPIETGVLIKQYANYSLNGFTDYLVISIFLSIIINKFNTIDYSQGTIRNYMVSGESRTTIYLSKVIISVVATAIFVLINIIINFLITLVLFGWKGNFTFILLLEFIARSLLVTLIYISITTMIVFLSHAFKSNGKVIGITLAINFIFQIIYSARTIAQMINPESKLTFLEVVSKIYIGSHIIDIINLGGKTLDAAIALLVAIITIILFIFLGTYKFKKAELK